MKLVLAAVPVLLLAAACGGGDGDRDLVKNADGLFVIERLDFEGVELEIVNLFEPHIPVPYPGIVARVDGDPITGNELFFKQVGQELERREAIFPLLRGVLLMNTEGDSDRPLESIIDERLLNQAVRRLHLLPPPPNFSGESEEMYALLEGRQREEVEQALRAQGQPLEGWSTSEAYVEDHRMTLGTLFLRRDECGGFQFACQRFLASERENAEIEYFVVWAE